MTSTPLDNDYVRRTVLVLDDDAPLRAASARILTRGGYRVLAAGTGREALDLADEYAGPVHLLLSDLVLPDATGSEVADRLRATRPHMRVLFMSGYSSSGSSRLDRPGEAWRYLAKPFDVDELLEAVGLASDLAASDEEAGERRA
ncbi:MAG: hypothetical protein AMXMBFR53_03670 [Gemmatimonadota bacterium]